MTTGVVPAVVDLWVLDLTSPPRDGSIAWLSPEERRRAASLRPGPRRERYVRAHVAVRAVLGEVLGRAPATVRFTTDALGRPQLAGGGPDVNLGYDAATAALVVAEDRRVGVDVVAPRAPERLGHVARAALTASERAACDGDPHAIARTFAAKEAYLKLLGCGLRRSPRGLEIRWDTTTFADGRVDDPDVADRAASVSLHARPTADATAVVVAVGPDRDDDGAAAVVHRHGPDEEGRP